MNFWESKKVLVTGGCGFLGAYLVEQLVSAGAQVRVVDNLENGSLSSISSVADKVEFIYGDIKDFHVSKHVSANVDVVMNLAGRAYGMEYSRNHHGEMLYHNSLMALNMLEAARLNKVSRFLVVSSSCVYPDDAPIPTREIPAMTGSPENVNEGYGWAKRIAELQAYYYQKEYGMNISICRPFNPYGGRYKWGGEKSHVLPTLVKRVMDGEDPLIVWGSGNQRRNFLHARDAAKLMMLITQNDKDAHPYNIGYEDDIAIGDLVRLICKISGRHPQIAFDKDKPEGRFRKCASSERLKLISGDFKPEIGLDDGIREMIQWYIRSFR